MIAAQLPAAAAAPLGTAAVMSLGNAQSFVAAYRNTLSTFSVAYGWVDKS